MGRFANLKLETRATRRKQIWGRHAGTVLIVLIELSREAFGGTWKLEEIKGDHPGVQLSPQRIGNPFLPPAHIEVRAGDYPSDHLTVTALHKTGGCETTQTVAITPDEETLENELVKALTAAAVGFT